MRRFILQPALLIACLVASLTQTACVRRTITITSEPSGALCWLNGREVGRTPVTVDFVHYGTYDVVLEADAREPLITTGHAKPPLWDNVPLDLFAEMVPGETESKIAWHYMLDPLNDNPTELVTRAKDMRQYQEDTTPPLPPPPDSQHATAPATTPATAPAEK